MDRRRGAMELLERLTAATSLTAFTEYTFPRVKDAHLAEQLERVERGDIDRLMLLRASSRENGKSTHERTGRPGIL
jgi:hypothetical protein